MDIRRIVSELKIERERINRAIAVLEGLDPQQLRVNRRGSPARRKDRGQGMRSLASPAIPAKIEEHLRNVLQFSPRKIMG